MNVIGFNKKFYTLWEVKTSEETEECGVKTITTIYTFVKNISKDLSKVQSKYPGVKIDRNVNCAMHSYKTTKLEWILNDRFRFGKYRGQKFSKVNDLDYTEWYFRNCESDRLHYEELMKFLKGHGYEFIIYDDMITPGMITPEEQVLNNAEKMHVQNLMGALAKGLPVTFVPTSNVSDEGLYFDNGIIFKFPEVKENYYNGFVYYTPAINGKGKRVKNRTVEVTDYTFTMKDIRTVEVSISKFNVR